MTFAKENAAEEGFNRWTINGVSLSHDRRDGPRLISSDSKASATASACATPATIFIPFIFIVTVLNLTSIAGKPSAGIFKDVLMLGGYQEAEVDFVADNPGLTLFHCHQQLHMDFGFMTLFDYTV